MVQDDKVEKVWHLLTVQARLEAREGQEGFRDRRRRKDGGGRLVGARRRGSVEWFRNNNGL